MEFWVLKKSQIQQYLKFSPAIELGKKPDLT